MDIMTNLPGRIRNTNLPKSHALLPLFEAVVNSIHAIEDAQLPLREGEIRIEVLREDCKYLSLDAELPEREIAGFRIVDNGVGFTDTNMSSFNTLDSEYKQLRGGKGIGRLLWLKAFRCVSVESVFENSDARYLRSFIFDLGGIRQMQTGLAEDSQPRQTVVCLQDFSSTYRKSVPKGAEAIAQALFEHCLWYYLRPGSAPHIVIYDEDKIVALDDIYEQNMLTSMETNNIVLREQPFELTHIKLRRTDLVPAIHYCVSHRQVKKVGLKDRIAGLFGKLPDPEGGDFHYLCHVTSPFLDEHIRSERVGFDIAEEQDGIFQGVELSFKEIDSAIIEQVERYLEPYLEVSREAGYKRITDFVEHRAPQYRPLLKRMRKEKLCLSPTCTPQDMELGLHKEKSRLEAELLKQGQRILKADGYEDDYQKQVDEYLAAIGDLKQSELAGYVVHRKVVLDFLSKLIAWTKEGKYHQEHTIHNLIMPMRKDSNDVASSENNLWLIDEKLVFHRYLSSAKSLRAIPITGSNSAREPDLLAVDLFDRPTLITDSHKMPLAALTIVEFKRPMRNDSNPNEDHDPIKQVMDYLELIRAGKILTEAGRPIPCSEKVPGFCYIICDLTPSMIKCCKFFGLKPTGDHWGYFGYNDNYLAYTEVISYDKLLQDAFQRNQAFFEKLGLSCIG